jgi:hypothetical protein
MRWKVTLLRFYNGKLQHNVYVHAVYVFIPFSFSHVSGFLVYSTTVHDIHCAIRHKKSSTWFYSIEQCQQKVV